MRYLRPRDATLALAALVLIVGAARAQFQDSIPEQLYFSGVEELYAGDLADAQRTFLRNLRGAIKTLGPQGEVRWVDSICYHALLGEALFQGGRYAEALEQFNNACLLHLQYPNWLLQVEFQQSVRPDASLARGGPSWGTTTRQSIPGKFASAYAVAMGQLDHSEVVRLGGVVQQAQYWQVNVAEILRATALAIRRRNEILGPLGPYDPLSKRLALQAMRGGGAPPNHWSGAWTAVIRGAAQAATGDAAAAHRIYDSGLLVGGQYDHPLTATALVEQGRLAMLAGQPQAAEQLLWEASYAAFNYGDGSVLCDAVRQLAENRFRAPQATTPLAERIALLAVWADRRRLGQVALRARLAAAEELLAGRQVAPATQLLAGNQGATRRLAGPLALEANFLAAAIEARAGREEGAAKAAAAADAYAAISLANFQIALANSMYDSQTLPSRAAIDLYALILADRDGDQYVGQPLESLAVMGTNHEPAFERWLAAALERRDWPQALAAMEGAKRRRYHAELALGGRLAAFGRLIAAPEAMLPPPVRQLRNDVLLRSPGLKEALARTQAARAQAATHWQGAAASQDDLERSNSLKAYAQAWEDLQNAVAAAALDRVSVTHDFPPRVDADELRRRLRPRQGILALHETSGGLIGLYATREGLALWNIASADRLGGLISQFLNDLGCHAGNRQLSVDELVGDDWHKSGAAFAAALLEGSPFAAGALDELIVVPDGAVWYAPLEAVWWAGEEQTGPLISQLRLRYAPTIGAAVSPGPRRRVQRTALLPGELIPGEQDEAVRNASLAALDDALGQPRRLERRSPLSSLAAATLVDELIVLEDLETERGGPGDWAPLPIDRPLGRGALTEWTTLLGWGPQRMALPGMHTPAERGGRAARRARDQAGHPGDELFFASCSLLEAGAQTVLLSRWRVGGQSTLDLVREFVLGARDAPAADAWQRSVQVAMETPLDLANELRVGPGRTTQELTAAHPFFWANGVVVDAGWAPPSAEPPAGVEAIAPPAAPGAAAPPPAEDEANPEEAPPPPPRPVSGE